MFFSTFQGGPPLRGRLTTDHPSSRNGVPVLVDEEGKHLPPDSIQCVIPDDEAMAEAARKAGYQVQTVMSVHLGRGATSPDL